MKPMMEMTKETPKSLRNWEQRAKKERNLPGAGQNGLFIKL